MEKVQKIGAIALVLLWVALPLAIGYSGSIGVIIAIVGLIMILASLGWKLHELKKGFSQGDYPPSRNR